MNSWFLHKSNSYCQVTVKTKQNKTQLIACWFLLSKGTLLSVSNDKGFYHSDIYYLDVNSHHML